MVLITLDELQRLYDGLNDGSVDDFNIHLGVLTRADGSRSLAITEQLEPLDVTLPITKVDSPVLPSKDATVITYENHPLSCMGVLYKKVFPKAKILLDYIESLYIINRVEGYTRNETSISVHNIEDFKPKEEHILIYSYVGFETQCHLWIPLVSMTQPMQLLLLSWFASIGKPRSCIADYITNFQLSTLDVKIRDVPRYTLSDSGESFVHNSQVYPFYKFQNDCRDAYGLLPGIDLVVHLDMRLLRNALSEALSKTKYVRLDDALITFVTLITKYNFRNYYKQIIVMYGRVTEALIATGLNVEMQCVDVIDLIIRCME